MSADSRIRTHRLTGDRTHALHSWRPLCSRRQHILCTTEGKSRFIYNFGGSATLTQLRFAGAQDACAICVRICAQTEPYPKLKLIFSSVENHIVWDSTKFRQEFRALHKRMTMVLIICTCSICFTAPKVKSIRCVPVRLEFMFNKTIKLYLFYYYRWTSTCAIKHAHCGISMQFTDCAPGTDHMDPECRLANDGKKHQLAISSRIVFFTLQHRFP